MFMTKEEGKTKILNPKGRTPIMKVDWSRIDLEKEIEARINSYVESYLQTNGVLERYNNIKVDVHLFHDKINATLSEMESEWIHTRQVVSRSYLGNFVIAIGFITSPIWLAAVTIGFGVAAAVAAGASFLFGALIGWNTKTVEQIDTEYVRHTKTIKAKIRTHLDENCGLVIFKLVDKITDDVIPKRIQAFKTLIKQILKTRDKILVNQELLENLAKQIKVIEETVTGLINSLSS